MTDTAYVRHETVNDRFKRTSPTWFWTGIILATTAHFVVIATWPELEAEDVSFEMDEIKSIEMPPEVEIPPPPQSIQRPAVPVVSANISTDITIDETTFEANPVEDLPPPPMAVDEETELAGGFSVYEVEPRILNEDEIQRALEEEYPPLLKDAGIGGTVQVVFSVDEEGRVFATEVVQSSNHPSLDEAALKIADVFRLSPALNRDKAVRVKVTFPITFRVR